MDLEDDPRYDPDKRFEDEVAGDASRMEWDAVNKAWKPKPRSNFWIHEEKKEVPISFTHPNREMFRNQIGAFLIEMLIDFDGGDPDPEFFVDQKIDHLFDIFDGKSGF